MSNEKALEVRAIMEKASKKGTLAGLRHTDVAQVIKAMEVQIAQAVPQGITAQRVVQMAAHLVSKSPAIAECSAQSIVSAVMEAAVLGLRISSSLGQCYFVPYSGKVQFQIGYRGWIELARRSGKIRDLYAHAVYDGDEFEYELGLDPKLKHKPGESQGKLTHVYAVAHYTDGGYSFYVMSRAEIEKLRLRNLAQRENPSGAWKTDYEEMAKAKVIKRLAKYMPLSDEMAVASIADDALMPEKLSNDNSGVVLDDLAYEIITPENTESHE
jgi:recombination protein RecT